MICLIYNLYSTIGTVLPSPEWAPTSSTVQDIHTTLSGYCILTWLQISLVPLSWDSWLPTAPQKQLLFCPPGIFGRSVQCMHKILISLYFRQLASYNVADMTFLLASGCIWHTTWELYNRAYLNLISIRCNLMGSLPQVSHALAISWLLGKVPAVTKSKNAAQASVIAYCCRMQRNYMLGSVLASVAPLQRLHHGSFQ